MSDSCHFNYSIHISYVKHIDVKAEFYFLVHSLQFTRTITGSCQNKL